MAIINIKNLNYGSLYNNLNLQVNKNEFITLSGANNCGKTTLIRILDSQIKGDFDINLYEKNISEYKIDELSKIIQTVIPNEIRFFEKNLYEEASLYTNGDNRLFESIVKGLKIRRLIEKDFDEYNQQEVILAQLCIALAIKPKILLIDNISGYFCSKEMEQILSFLKEYSEKNELTIINTTINLEESLFTDRLIIINDGIIELDGEPIEILQKDNIINKIGLSIPFMIDLSVKLKDYDLLNEIEMDKNRMVDKLWN